MYMDDGSGGHSTFEGAEQVATRMRQGLVKAGFMPNEKKCKWIPSQSVELLGMKIDLQCGIIKATEGRVAKLKGNSSPKFCSQINADSRPPTRKKSGCNAAVHYSLRSIIE